MSKLSQITKGIDCQIVGSDLKVAGLKYDSRQVEAGDLFFAIPGFKVDGHHFINDAISKGAVAIVVEELQPIKENITQVIVKDSREAMGLIAANFYGNPANKLKMIGITGTNGKTTTTYLIKGILEEAG